MCFRAMRVLGVLHLCFHHFEVFFEEGMKEIRHRYRMRIRIVMRDRIVIPDTDSHPGYVRECGVIYAVARLPRFLESIIFTSETIPKP